MHFTQVLRVTFILHSTFFIFHSTPLALWRGVGGEAFSLFLYPMQIELSYLLGPLMGGIIGYITNYLAIRMMFRPHQPKHIFGKRIPFTPGIIPKERFRIAEAVGDSISENLMNKEVLAKNLLSEEMLGKIGESYDTFISTQKKNKETLREFLAHYLPASDIDAIQADTSTELALQLHTRLSDSELGSVMAHAVIEHVMMKMSSGVMGFLGADKFLSFLEGPAEHQLEKHINQIIANNSEEIISNFVAQESNHLLDTPVSDLLKDHDEQIVQLRHILLEGYTTIITTHLPKILSTLDISKIIRDRINEMDMMETEKIILDVMKKELNAIVWLGALLGCIIGTVNSFF